MNGLEMKWRMCYVSVCSVFLHHDSNSCCGIVTSVGSHAVTRMVTCYDLAHVGRDLDRHSDFGCPWNAAFAVAGCATVTEIVCLD